MAKSKIKPLTNAEISDIRKILKAKERLLEKLHPDGSFESFPTVLNDPRVNEIYRYVQEQMRKEENEKQIKKDAKFLAHTVLGLDARACGDIKHLRLRRWQIEEVEHRAILWLREHVIPHLWLYKQ